MTNIEMLERTLCQEILRHRVGDRPYSPRQNIVSLVLVKAVDSVTDFNFCQACN